MPSPRNKVQPTTANDAETDKDSIVVAEKEKSPQDGEMSLEELKTEMERLAQERNDALSREKNSRDETQALVDALDLLSLLASMDNEVYSSTLSGSLGGWDPDKDASSIQNRIDALQERWKLEQTPVPMLLRCIHRLQSNTSNLVQEADQQTLQVQTMEAYCEKQAKRQVKLEKAIHKLHEQNRKLKDKLRSKRKERKSFIKHVKEYVNKANLVNKKKEELSIEEQRMAQQLKAHERLLRLERAALDDGHSGGNRSRVSTFDSSTQDPCGGNRSRGSTCDSQDLSSDNDRDEAASVVSSMSSTSTGSSLVTDDGVATIRYNVPLSHSPVPSTPSSKQDKHEDDPWASMRAAFGGFKSPEKPPTVYNLTFPAGTTKIGLQFHKVPLEKEKPVIRMPLLNEALLLDTDTPNARNTSKESDIKSNGQSEVKSATTAAPPRGLQKHFNFDSILRRSVRDEDTPQQKVFRNNSSRDDESATSFPEEGTDVAFLVCGYSGFDSDQNVRPTLGARLVAVDGRSLEEGKWTLSMVRDIMQARAANDDSSSTFTMSFRNENLNRKQKDILQRAVKAAEQQAESTKKQESQSVSAGTDETASSVADGEADARNEEVAQQKKEKPEVRDETPVGSESSVGSENGKAEVDKSPSGQKPVAVAQPGDKFKNSMKEMGNKFKNLF